MLLKIVSASIKLMQISLIGSIEWNILVTALKYQPESIRTHSFPANHTEDDEDEEHHVSYSRSAVCENRSFR